MIFFSLCVIDIVSKYPWFVPLKDKKSITRTNAFQKILTESNCKRNKIWVDKGSEIYNRSVKPWLQEPDIEICLAQNEGKSVFAERSMYKYITSIMKNVYIDKLAVIVTEYNKISLNTISK